MFQKGSDTKEIGEVVNGFAYYSQSYSLTSIVVWTIGDGVFGCGSYSLIAAAGS